MHLRPHVLHRKGSRNKRLTFFREPFILPNFQYLTFIRNTVNIRSVIDHMPHRERPMANVEKVQELLGTQDISQLLTLMLDTNAQAYSSRFGDKNGADLAEMRDFNSRLLNKVKPRVLELISEIYAKHFTDDELDTLIAIQKTPVFVKMRAVMPMIQQDIVAALTSSTFVDMVKVVSEIEDEMRWSRIASRIDDETRVEPSKTPPT